MNYINRIEFKQKFDPLTLFQSLRQRYQSVILLESGGGPKKMATQSVICFDPAHMLQVQGNCLLIDGTIVAEEIDQILKEMRNLIERYELPPQTVFSGGLVGYVSFDMFDLIEKSIEKKGESLFHKAALGFFLDGIVFDHISGKTYYFHHNEFKCRYSEILDLLDGYGKSRTASINDISLCYGTSKEEFETMVNEAKLRIEQGEIFQVVLSQRGKFRFSGDPVCLYEILRQENPSPYMYILQFGDLSIIGTSPELLISETDGTIITYPIAGTRKVYDDPNRMKKAIDELLSDPKELAEHNMLVDLARNDLGKVAEIGSVEIPEYKTIQRFSHVVHIVSKVQAKLAKGKDMFDAFLSVFPAGTVSGAPKIRAIEIIRDLETEPRGPYAGSVGYFGLGKNMVQAIAIRTAFGIGNEFFIQAGAGIVFDSVPELEYKETLNKLAVFSEILGNLPVR